MTADPDLKHYAVTFDRTLHLSKEFSRYLSPLVQNSSAKRKSEFIAGRLCADRALSQFSLRSQEQRRSEVSILEDHSPGWPDGFVGSITHGNQYAWAAVGKKEIWRSVGIDTERILSEATCLEISSLIAGKPELSYLQNLFSIRILVTILFSAKESVFKCIYPLVRTHFDFLDVEMYKLDPFTQSFSIRILVHLDSQFPRGTIISGQYELTESSVHTLVTLRSETPGSS